MSQKLKTNLNVDNLSGLFYIDYKDIFIYNKPNDSNFIKQKDINPDELTNYEFNQAASQAHYNNCIDKISDYMANNFDSMLKTDLREKKKHIIAANQLFQVTLEDNDWSVAVQLLPVKKANKGLQKQMYYAFLHGLRNALFEQFNTLYVRNGSWSQIAITKNDDPNMGNELIDMDADI
jgi:hypothetical protein